MSRLILWISLLLDWLGYFSKTFYSPFMWTINDLYPAFPRVTTATSPPTPHTLMYDFISVDSVLYPFSTRLVINTTTKLIKGLSIFAGWESQLNKSILVTNEEEL